ncbi:MFS transporter [Pseudonocardia xinjiangensis]|uniref:MFS transporter n=1 Tax=Pseudonocardia xinjiangensis TaxID=75289 RepID=UPI003D90BEA0
MSVSIPQQARTAAPASRRHDVGFWLVAFSFLTAMAFSTVPTPLYAIYQQQDGFSTLTVTIVFGAYAIGVVTSLLLAGHVSDWLGRKRVLIAALAVLTVSALIFLIWHALPALLVARLLCGLGVGMVTATATAFLNELHAAGRPDSGQGRFELVSTAANIGGLGVGPLVSGYLAQFVAAPLRTPFAVFTVLLLLSIVAVSLSPETVQRPAERPRYHPQRVTADHGDRAGFVAAAAGAFLSFTIFGLATSLDPGFVAGTLHQPGRLLAGAVAFVVFGAAALAQSTTTSMPLGTRNALGLAGVAIGMIALVTGMEITSFAAFLIGSAVAGAGAGVLFKSAVGTVAAMAAPAVRGEALATLFFVSYVGLILPTLALGIASRFVDARTSMVWFGAVMLLLAAGAAVLARRVRTRSA